MNSLKYLLLATLISTPLWAKDKDADLLNWRQKMHELRGELVELSPYIYSESQFKNPKNQKVISNHLNKMKKIGHKIDAESQKKYSEKDPSFDYILERLDEDLQLASEAFQEKKFEFSQNTMKSAVNRCFQCHTQNFDKSQWQGSFNTKGSQFLSSAEKADFLIAMRNFSEASSVLETDLLASSNPSVNPLELEQILQKYVLVSIRNEQNPKASLAFLKKLKQKEGLPSFLIKKINSYEESLVSWKDFSKEDRLEAAKSLLKKAEAKSDFLSDSKGFIESLRASSFLHEYLQEKNLSKENIALSYYLLGSAYQNISEPNYWDMHETYFARCIKSLPHSKLAKSCFKSYKDSVVLRHSGSAGIQMPLRVKLGLDNLEKLSK